MAVGSAFSSFEDNKAWVQVNYDDVALEMISIVYKNETSKRAIVNIVQANRNNTFEALPGAGVPNPITQSIPNNRYTYSLNAKGDLSPDFTYSVTFQT